MCENNRDGQLAKSCWSISMTGDKAGFRVKRDGMPSALITEQVTK
jgi:hypothetical protein